MSKEFLVICALCAGLSFALVSTVSKGTLSLAATIHAASNPDDFSAKFIRVGN